MTENLLSSRTRRPSFADIFNLFLTQAARFRRTHLGDGTTSDNFYADFFDTEDLEAATHDHRKLLRQKTICEYLDRAYNGAADLLEVGCGMGELLNVLPRRFRLQGVEYSPVTVRMARTLLGHKASVTQGDIYDLPFESESFDICICLEVLEHVPDDVKAVRELRRVVRSGGTLIVSVPYSYYWPQYRKLIGHYRHYSRTSIERLLESAGFRLAHYLPNYVKWNRAYDWRYVLLKAQSIMMGRIAHRSSVYTFRYPWSNRPAIEQLASRLEKLKRREETLNYNELDTSTFVVARA